MAVLHALATVGLGPGIVESITEHREGSGSPPCNTNGRWYCLELSKETLGAMFCDPALWDSTEAVDWQTAWHGTAIHNLPKLLTHGMQRGPNAIPDPKGRVTAKVYCEGTDRKHCAFAYSTHVGVPGGNPNLTFGALLELLVDRRRGTTSRKQWQQDEGSAHICAVWVHVADLRKAYDNGFVGTLRVHKPQYDKGVRGLRKGDYLKDVREYLLTSAAGST